MPAVESYPGTRVVAEPAALDAATWPAGCAVLRLAADEALVLGAESLEVVDPHALVEVETGVCGAAMDLQELGAWMEREADWPPPAAGHAQGMVAGLPVHVWVDDDTALVLTRASLRHELEERL